MAPLGTYYYWLGHLNIIKFYMSSYKFFFNSVYQSIYYIYIILFYLFLVLFIYFKAKNNIFIFNIKTKNIIYQNLLDIYNNSFKLK